MQHRQRFRRAGARDLPDDLVLPALQPRQFPRHRRAAVPVLDQLQQVADLTAELCVLLLQPRTLLPASAVGGVYLGDEGAHELLDQFRGQQPMLQARHHPLEQPRPQHRPRIAAGTPLAAVCAAQPAVARHHAHRAIAHSAAHQT
ncbi:hypothetical protein OL599_24900 [Rhodovastum sp. RN2-1]|uniref:Uncharacterized protein n=1 Tax=Limobrevibacterium gyesilva TaxID=2991712 RepID=A0AA41YT02_9PROT|nr:hypothetical protein [Limobrevibacterium gyesilva]MCW3477793.1 hypothetical protein [Limobrevibacterium gyesilva]